MKEVEKAHRKRRAQQKRYDKFNIEPTEVNGIMVKSRLEALWIEELSSCSSFICIECVEVPVGITGPYGKFLGSYKPDLIIENADGRIHVELKPTTDMALGDDRQQRALELNPRMKFAVIGGYPYAKKGVTLRLLTGKQELVHKDITVDQIKQFFGCGV